MRPMSPFSSGYFTEQRAAATVKDATCIRPVFRTRKAHLIGAKAPRDTRQPGGESVILEKVKQ